MYQLPERSECQYCMCSFKDKEVQRDAKMVSYKVVDKSAKPYVEVDVAGEKKVGPRPGCWLRTHAPVDAAYKASPLFIGHAG